MLPILKQGGFISLQSNAKVGEKISQNTRSYKDYLTMFSNANTKSLLQALKETMREPIVKKSSAIKPTLGQLEFKVAVIRKQ